MIGALVKMLYGFRYTDMGPFRAIRRECLEAMQMREMTYGWNLEMQIKAVKMGLRVVEIPVDYRCRIGWRVEGIGECVGEREGGREDSGSAGKSSVNFAVL